MDPSELAFWYWLTDVKGIGPVISRRILDRFSDPYQVYQASASDIIEKTGIKSHLAANIEQAKQGIDKYNRLAVQQLEIASKIGGRILTCNDGLYREVYRQRKEDDALPTIIHILGNEKCLDARRFAIVGTRHPSDHGKMFARNLAYDLTSHGISVVSGMAVGIDAQAHSGALDGSGATIAILGCGVNIPYPPENTQLYRRIIERGLLLSEFPFGVRITTENLRKRNRTIVAFSEGTIVAECPIKSGAMIAARFTSQQKKPLFTFVYGSDVDNSGGMWLIDHHLAAELTSPTLNSLESVLTRFTGKIDVKVDKAYEELWPKKKKPPITTERPKTVKAKKEGVKPAKKSGSPAVNATLEGVQKELPLGGDKQAAQEEKPLAGLIFKEGDRVMHPKFGAGEIMKIAPMQGDFQVTIRFSPRKTQTFLLKYANLTPVK